MMNPSQPENIGTQPTMDRPLQEETGKTATEKLQEGARQIGDRLQEKGKYVADKTDEALSSVGHGVASLADKMRDHAPEGKLGETLQKVAAGLDKGGHYLDESRFSDMQKDATELIRKYPTQSLAAGLAFGFLLGATLSVATRK